MTQPAIRLRPVRAGDDITVQVENGFVRRRASEDGIVIELPDRDLFLSTEPVLECLRALGKVPASP